MFYRFSIMKNIVLLTALILPVALTAQTYVKVSGGALNLSSDGLLNYIGLDTSISNDTITSIEFGIHSTKNLTFGFEYGTFNTSASIGGIIDSEDAFDLNYVFETTFFSSGQTGFIKEDYDFQRFSFTVNYETDFSESFTILLNSGLGWMDAEQSLTVAVADESVRYSARDSLFTYQIGAALGYRLNDACTIYGGIRYLGAGNVIFKYDDDTIIGDDADAIAYELSLKYSF